MDLSKIISISGKPGLYRIVAQGRQALIVESLTDNKRTPVHSSVKVSSLDEISMFTTGEDVPLAKVLESLHKVEKGKASLDPKKADDDTLFKKLGEALPEHDRDRIYPSDVRKLFTWYAQLLKAGDFDKKEEKKKKGDAKDGDKKAKSTKAAKGTDEPVKTKAKKAAAPKKQAATTKAKATSMRKSAQRGG